MATGQGGMALRELTRLFRDGASAGLTDRQLLARFASARDERAFATLVERHGPMVLGVCRRILRDPDAAEDAFQAAFLVLVRKAGSIRVDDSLGRWLYTVARRIALRIVAQSIRREAAESRHPRDEPGDRPDRRDQITAIHEELGRLRESYRAVLVLCHLQDLSHEEAARRLGWPLGTVKGRLVRARALLRSRLVRRGLGLSAGGLAATLRPASVSALLVERTVSAAIEFAADRAAATGAFPAAVALAKGALDVMFVSKLKLVGVGLLACMVGAFVVGSGIVRLPRDVAGRTLLANDGPPAAKPASVVPAKKERLRISRLSQPGYIVEAPDVLQIEVLETLPGKPISGERLVRPDGTISLQWYGSVDVGGLTVDQIKEKLILHLRKFLSDEALGLVRQDGQRTIAVSPGDSDLVFVNVAVYRSKVYFVLGDVNNPGPHPIIGDETVLDAIDQANGVKGIIGRPIRLVRPATKGSREQIFPVDFWAIAGLGDKTTNYRLVANDRLIVYRENETPAAALAPAPSAALDPHVKEVEQRIDGLVRELEALKRELKK